MAKRTISRPGRQSATKVPTPPGLKLVRDKTGEIKYIYHRKSGMTPIFAKLGTPAFWAEYLALERKPISAKKIRGSRHGHRPGSWGELVESYRNSPEFNKLRDRTKQDYEKVLDYLDTLNEASVGSFTRDECKAIRNKAFVQHKLRFANYVASVLSVVFSWGVENKSLPLNPARKLKIAKPTDAPQANRPWTENEQKIVITEAKGSLRNAIALGMFASMRGGDVVRTKWSAYTGVSILWQQGKNGDTVSKPARRALREILDAAPRIGETIVAGPDGRPWTEGTLRKLFRNLILRLENEGRIAKGITFHGLRTTNATRLANLGADIRAIQAELGQRTAVMALHYSREADMKRAAATAVRLLDDER